MGNRAVITNSLYDSNGNIITNPDIYIKANQIGVYLHFNGGYDSVSAFLKYCELKEYREPNKDNYGWARLCQVIGNYFGGTLSIGIDTFNNLDTDNYDNGVYLINGWEIVGRLYHSGKEKQNYDFNEMIKDIDEAQPEKERIMK